jgi:beta-glucosidase
MKTRPVLSLLMFVCTVSTVQTSAQPYKDSTLHIELRVMDLLSRMTPEEKFWQLFMIPGDLGSEPQRYHHGLFGFQVGASGEVSGAAGQLLKYDQRQDALQHAHKINQIQRYFIEESRLGIPIIPFDEALHGLVRSGATAFPQAIGLSATWNTELMDQVASAIAVECVSRGIRQVLSPVVNVAGDVRWGRTEETYGEDPLLVSAMGLAFVEAFERRGVITTPKHFLANVGDGGRDSYPIHWNERLLREIYLPPFEICFREGKSRSVMTAYNSLDGTPCTAHPWLLNQLLREEWGFDGFVISDAGGTGGANVLHFTAADYPDATTKSLRGGLDVIFQTSYDHHTLFMPPFLDGSIPQPVIDSAVARVLRMKFALGLFENPYVDTTFAHRINGCDDHRKLAKQAAVEGAVLLKNDAGILPFPHHIKTIAVIGPDAKEARLGGYSGPGNNVVSILEGIRSRAGAMIDVRYTIGCQRESVEFVPVPASALSCVMDGRKQDGLKGEYFNNVDFSGDPVFTRCDPEVRFQWTLFGPDPDKLTYDFWSVRWIGQLVSPVSGKVKLGVDGNDGFRIYLDDKLILERWVKRSCGQHVVEVDLVKNRPYSVRIEFYEPVGNAWFSLIWDVGAPADEEQAIREAVTLASRCDRVLVVAGIEEGEFLDRARLTLPGRQQALIRRVAATGKPVVVLLVGGSAVIMDDWIDAVAGVMMVWYPGEAGGDAIAGLLFGDHSPGGKLPITFPVAEGQLPLVYNHKPTGRGDDYLDMTGQPAFPFGFGLSYTSFMYRDITLGQSRILPTDTTSLQVTITNTGTMKGDEVVQLYLRDELSSVATAVMKLVGFQRITLKPGESRMVSFAITPEMLALYDANMKRVVEPGIFRLMIGSSSKDIRQRTFLEVAQ